MKKAIGSLYRLVDVAGIICLILLVLLVFAQVVFRYVGVPSPWTEELARFAFVYITFLGSITALRQETHIEIDVLLNFMPPRLRHAVRTLTYIVIGVFMTLFVRGALMTIQTSGNVRSSSLLWFKMNYIFIVVLTAGIAMILISLANALRHAAQAIRPVAGQKEAP